MRLTYTIDIEETDEAFFCEGCEFERPKDRGMPEFKFEVNGIIRTLCHGCAMDRAEKVGLSIARQIEYAW